MVLVVLFTVTCAKVEDALYYGCIVTDTPLPLNIFNGGRINVSGLTGLVCLDVNKNRRKSISGFTPGTVYYFYYYAGNAAGVSGLSAPVPLMAI